MDSSIKKPFLGPIGKVVFTENYTVGSTFKVAKGCLYRLLFRDTLIYFSLYFLINFIYRFALEIEQQREMSLYISYFEERLQPYSRDLTFLLGFYVSVLMKRWWDQYSKLPRSDAIGILLNGLVVNTDPVKSRIFRTTIIRYFLLAYVLCLRRFSKNLQKVLPSQASLLESGLIRKDELEKIRILENEPGNEYWIPNSWWIPISWASNSVGNARDNKLIPSDSKEIFTEIMKFRKGLEDVESYNTMHIPLVYTQVVHIAVYLYFLFALIAWQEPSSKDSADIYIPLYLIIKFIFFMGWLKVAEAIHNPFGMDDEDFHLQPLLMRHIEAARTILDSYENLPSLLPDVLWNVYPDKTSEILELGQDDFLKEE